MRRPRAYAREDRRPRTAGLWSPDGSLVALAGLRTGIVYDASTGERVHVFNPAWDTIRRIRFSDDGALLLADGHRLGVVAWRMDGGEEDPPQTLTESNERRILVDDPRPIEAIRAQNLWARERFECPMAEEAVGAFARFEENDRTLVFGSGGGKTHRRAIPLRGAKGLRLSPDGAFCAVLGPSTVTFYRVADGRRLGKVQVSGYLPGLRFLAERPELLVHEGFNTKDGGWGLVRGFAQADPRSERVGVELCADLGVAILRTADSVVALDSEGLKTLFEEPFERAGRSELRADGVLLVASLEDATLPQGVPHGRELGVWNVLMDEPRLRLRLRGAAPIHLAQLSPDGRRLLVGGVFGAHLLTVPSPYAPPPSPPGQEPEPPAEEPSSEFASTFARLRREGCPRCAGRIESAGDLPVCVRCGPLCPYCLTLASVPCPRRVLTGDLYPSKVWTVEGLEATRPSPLSPLVGDAFPHQEIPEALFVEGRPAGEVWRASRESWALTVARLCRVANVSAAVGAVPALGEWSKKSLVFAAHPERFVERARWAAALLAGRTPPPVPQPVEAVLWPFGERVTEGAWSPDGRHVALVAKGAATVCEAATGAVLRTLPLRSSPVRAVAFSPDGSALSALYARSRTDWSLADGEPVGGKRYRTANETPPLPADGTLMAAKRGAADPKREADREEGARDNKLLVWPKSAELPIAFRTTSPIRVARLSPDGRRILLGGDFGALVVRAA